MNRLRIKIKEEHYWKEHYILESEIEDIIRFEINEGKRDRFIFCTKKEEIVRDIKKYVISVLLGSIENLEFNLRKIHCIIKSYRMSI